MSFARLCSPVDTRASTACTSATPLRLPDTLTLHIRVYIMDFDLAIRAATPHPLLGKQPPLPHQAPVPNQYFSGTFLVRHISCVTVAVMPAGIKRRVTIRLIFGGFNSAVSHPYNILVLMNLNSLCRAPEAVLPPACTSV